MHILQKYILDNNLNLAELANILGYDIGNLSKVINGIIGVSPRLANAIKQKLQLDIEVTKRPKRYNTEKKEDFILNEPKVLYKASTASPVYNEVMQVPTAQTKAAAGYALRYRDETYIENLPKTHVPIEYAKGNYLVFEIDGDSMDDNTGNGIRSGDMVLCKELCKSLWSDKLHYNSYHFVIVFDNSTILKQITKHDVETGQITCHSLNPTYEDFILNLDEVSQLFYAIKIVERTIKL